MGECYCSNIAIMQLFHELKQQFPALPDHIVSQCIAQNSHDKETCARSLRATQESRPSPGAFPPPSPGHIDPPPQLPLQQDCDDPPSRRRGALNAQSSRPTILPNGGASSIATSAINQNGSRPPHARAHRPVSLDIGGVLGTTLRRCSRSPNGHARHPTTSRNETTPRESSSSPGPLSAPPAFYPTRGFFDDIPDDSRRSAAGPKFAADANTTTAIGANCIPNSSVARETKPRNRGNQPTGTAFELNVNVACSPAGNRDFRTVPTVGVGKRSDLVVEPRPHYAEPRLAQSSKPPCLLNHQQQQQQQQPQDHTRSYTSVSLTLRPPSSEPQPPIDIRSQGSSLTYSTSSLDPRGFQSRLQISIGPGNVGSVASARIRPPMAHPRPTSLIPHLQAGPQRPPGLPAGPPSQLPRPTTTMSAPTTPSAPTISLVQPASLPTTPSTAPTIAASSPPAVSPMTRDRNQMSLDLNRLSLSQVTEQQKLLVAEQLMRKERLAKELRAEQGRLEAMKRELQALMRPLDSTIPPEELKRNLKSEIYQLQLECDRLADEVDKRSDPRVPLGETNEEFYQGIYTGQQFAFNGNYAAGSAATRSPEPPPLPSRPPAWQVPASRVNSHSDDNTAGDRRENVDNEDDDNWDERDGPSWVCRMCTFDNHPLMDKCEQCDMPRLLVHDTGETQDIHIRVTHHHNFSPRRTVHSWVV